MVQLASIVDGEITDRTQPGVWNAVVNPATERPPSSSRQLDARSSGTRFSPRSRVTPFPIRSVAVPASFTGHTVPRSHSRGSRFARTTHAPNRTRSKPRAARCQRLHSIPATTTTPQPHASPADCVPRLASLTDFVRSHRGSYFVRTAYRSPPVLAPRTRVEIRGRFAFASLPRFQSARHRWSLAKPQTMIAQPLPSRGVKIMRINTFQNTRPENSENR